ncbi:MAG: hypothetical protein VX899_03300 [Myxococcota bacterium]|nr:hypothetical protein [Myxococcota bacterium]
MSARLVFGESPIKDLYRKVIWGPYREALGRLPAGWELRANRRLGQLAAVGARGKGAQLRRNLARAFPGRDLDPIVRQVFETHFVDQYISWTFARIAAGQGSAYLEIRGLEHLEAARAQGRGAVLIHPHMGPAQLPLCELGARGVPVLQVGGGGVEGPISAEGARVTALRHALEKDIPGQILDGGGYVRPVLRALADNQVVLTACDGTGGGKEMGRRIPKAVLGQRMRLPVGGVWFALKSGAPLLTLVTHREAKGWVSEIGAPLPLDRSLPTKAALDQGAEFIAEFLGRCLHQWPGDWHFWDEFEPGRFLEAP